MRHILLLITLVVNSFLFGQTDYTPAESDESLQKEYLYLVNKKLSTDLKSLDGEYKKDLKQFHKTRVESIESRVENNHFLFDARLINFLDQIKDEIAVNNPEYDFSNIQLVIARYTWPNAFSMGEGTIAINVGLFPYFENEDQLAFVLCHEFAHYLLDHGNKTFLSQIKSYDSEEYKAKVETIRKSDYYQATKLKKLVKENIYSERKHSRSLEFQADSMGLLFYLKTKYAPVHALTTMDLLERLNEEIAQTYIDVYSILGLERSVEEEKSSLLSVTKEKEQLLEKDSVKTHPACMERKAILSSSIDQAGKKKESTASLNNNSASFDEIIYEMRLEKIESQLIFQYSDDALLSALRMLEEQPELKYLQHIVLKSLYDLTWARKDHRISDFASPKVDTIDLALIELNEIIFKSRYSQFKKATYHYYQTHLGEDQEEELLYNYYWLALENDDDKTAEKTKLTYLNLYPAGLYYDLFFLKH